MDKILGIFSFIKGWVSSRLKERTSWDGAIVIAVCLSIILFGGIAKLAAWAGLVWGVYTLIKSQ